MSQPETQKTNIMQFPVKSKYKPDTAAHFEKEQLPSTDLLWLEAARTEALARLKKFGLPTPRLERFKNTNLIPALRDMPSKLTKHDVTIGEGSDEAVLWDLSSKLDEEWVQELLSVKPYGIEQYKDTMLWDVNTAYIEHGGVIDVPANTKIEQPIVVHLTGHDGEFTAPRTLIRVGQGAEVTIIEHITGEGKYWRNRTTQVLVGANAKVKHYRTQLESGDLVHTQNTYASVERDARYETFTLGAGGKMVRNHIFIDLIGTGAHCDTSAINLAGQSDHIDNTYTVNHIAAHCTSNQFVRSVLRDQARSVYQGKIHVYQEAQKTDAYQMSNAMLLSDAAEMNVKPELEIYADDVLCSHGTTSGEIDDEALFYLRARGISEKEARALLIQSFIAEVLDVIKDDNFRDLCDQEVLKWLQA